MKRRLPEHFWMYALVPNAPLSVQALAAPDGYEQGLGCQAGVPRREITL